MESNWEFEMPPKKVWHLWHQYQLYRAAAGEAGLPGRLVMLSSGGVASVDEAVGAGRGGPVRRAPTVLPAQDSPFWRGD